MVFRHQQGSRPTRPNAFSLRFPGAVTLPISLFPPACALGRRTRRRMTGAFPMPWPRAAASRARRKAESKTVRVSFRNTLAAWLCLQWGEANHVGDVHPMCWSSAKARPRGSLLDGRLPTRARDQSAYPDDPSPPPGEPVEITKPTKRSAPVEVRTPMPAPRC